MDMSQNQNQLKRCISCLRNLPLNFFGPYRQSKDGYSSHCKECHRDYSRKAKAKMYGISDPDKAKHANLVFHFDTHNQKMLKLAFMRFPSELLAFQVLSGIESRVTFTKDDSGLCRMTMVQLSGMVLGYVSFDIQHLVHASDGLLKVLKDNRLRLEKNQLSMWEAKTVIYGFQKK